MQFADRNSPHNDAGTPRRMSLSRGRVLEFRQKPQINDESRPIRVGKRSQPPIELIDEILPVERLVVIVG